MVIKNKKPLALKRAADQVIKPPYMYIHITRLKIQKEVPSTLKVKVTRLNATLSQSFQK